MFLFIRGRLGGYFVKEKMKGLLPAVFHQAQPAQSALSAAVATVGGSGSLPVILRPDELSEALKVGVNELLSLYGIH